jgi:hypothetical protein
MIKSRRIGEAGHVALKGVKKNSYRILVGKPERKRPLGRPRHRWEVNIKIYLRGIEWGAIDWIDLTQGMDQWRALAKNVMNIRVP